MIRAYQEGALNQTPGLYGMMLVSLDVPQVRVSPQERGVAIDRALN